MCKSIAVLTEPCELRSHLHDSLVAIEHLRHAGQNGGVVPEERHHQPLGPHQHVVQHVVRDLRRQGGAINAPDERL